MERKRTCRISYLLLMCYTLISFKCPHIYCQKIYALSHATNDLETAEWAMNSGANALEMDLNFDPTSGEPTRFHHGWPCDCTCLGGFAGTVCELPSQCERESVPQDLFSSLSKFPTLAMIYIDSKVRGMSGALQRQAALKVVQMVDTHLFGKGYRGIVLISSEYDTAYVEAAAEFANKSIYSSRIFFTVDNGSEKYNIKFDKLLNLPTTNVMYSTGKSSCFHFQASYQKECSLAFQDKQEGILIKEVIIWTVDTTDLFESYYTSGVRGFITNSVPSLLKWAESHGIGLYLPGDVPINMH